MRIIYKQDGLYVVLETDDIDDIHEGGSVSFETYEEALREYFNQNPKEELQMTINFQIMTEDQKINGQYRPDYKKLMENAKTGEELTYIQKIAENKSTFVYNMVYVTRQKCGHYEIFQTPVNKYHPLEMELEIARDMTSRECTRCICGW